jgi:hypothetical protein
LMRVSKSLQYFKDEMDETYAIGMFDGKQKTFKINGRHFKCMLIMEFEKETGTAPSTESLSQVINMLDAKCRCYGEVKKGYVRVGQKGESIYYDLADEEGHIVQVTKQGCRLTEAFNVFFKKGKNLKEQAMPNFNGNISTIGKYIRMKSKQDLLLYIVYLVTCLIPFIPHPILVFHGQKGAAKSTALKLTKSIIDPALVMLKGMPNSMQDLAIALSNSYMACFDNLEVLSTEKSNMLCTASTGGGYSTRELYTNGDEAVMSLQNCVGLNGINLVVVKDDIIDRSLIFELERIPSEVRKSESEFWSEFEKDKPDIIGGALQILHKAMNIKENVRLNEVDVERHFAFGSNCKLKLLENA